MSTSPCGFQPTTGIGYNIAYKTSDQNPNIRTVIAGGHNVGNGQCLFTHFLNFLSISRDIPELLHLIAIAFTSLYFTIRMLGTCDAIYPFFFHIKCMASHVMHSRQYSGVHCELPTFPSLIVHALTSS